MMDILSELTVFKGFGGVLMEVAFALIPLLIFFGVCQIFFLKLPKSRIINIIKGVVLTFLGLSLFLQGVHVGFEPAGTMIGETLGETEHRWILLPIGFILGFVATIAEPAIRILNHEVEKVSGGYIPQKVLLYTLCIGVGLSISLSIIRILYGIPLYWMILPGYGIALTLIFFSTPTFTSVAFDSGGVATGPMTVTFIMAIAIGVASVTEGRDPLVEGFGMIALVALTPILSVLVLGLIYSWKEKREADNG